MPDEDEQDEREPGRQGGDADKLPAEPADDDSPLGDTDEHSDA